MNNFAIAAIAWIGLAAHVVVGVMALRSGGSRPLVPLLNLITASCVLAYWANKWFSYLFRGITWYATDQLVPLYAILVCALSLLTLTGRQIPGALTWLVFGIHLVVLMAAALFLTFFRMNRLI